MPDGYRPLLMYALVTSDACRTINERLNEMAVDGHIVLPVYVSKKTNGLSFLLLYGSEATIEELMRWLR